MKENHKILFEPYQLAGCTLENRYVMAAMGTGGMVTAENTFNERGIEYYVARAKGGVGLIITGTIYAENDIEKAVDGTMPCPTDNPSTFIMNTAEMCERVHAYGSKIFTQLTAGFGRVLKPHLLCGQPPIAPSPIRQALTVLKSMPSMRDIFWISLPFRSLTNGRMNTADAWRTVSGLPVK